MNSISLNTVRATAAVFGVCTGIIGMEHGYFETLQWNAGPRD